MRPWWKPLWTRQAGMRALRATLVVPALFAICLKVIGDPQMTLFATFGGFATLVVASFGGTRKDKLAGHVGLAIVHRLVTANGGSIRLADTPGGGLTVEVDLPSPSDP